LRIGWGIEGETKEEGKKWGEGLGEGREFRREMNAPLNPKLPGIFREKKGPRFAEKKGR